jgi:hypothetical protein
MIKADKDAYGREVLAYMNKKRSYEMVERDDGYKSLSTCPKAYFTEYRD